MAVSAPTKLTISQCVFRAPLTLRPKIAGRALSTTPRNFFAAGDAVRVGRQGFKQTQARCRVAGVLGSQWARDDVWSSARARAYLQTRRQQSTATESSSTNDTVPPPEQPRRPLRRFLLTTTFFALAFTLSLTMASAPASEAINGWVAPPTDAETLALVNPSTPSAQALNERLLNLPLVRALRDDPAFVESRPHMKIPPGMRAHSLTAGVLMQEGCLEIPPLNFASGGSSSRESTPANGEQQQQQSNGTPALPELTQIMYLGAYVCGHAGIVHGGMLATMLDEGLARCCFPALPNRIGVTASLKIDYRVPCRAGQFVVLKARTTKVEGRKAWVEGWIEAVDESGEGGDGVRIVEAEALFIEPKQAKNLARLAGAQA